MRVGQFKDIRRRSLFLNRSTEVVVGSPGGVGTTLLLRELQKYCKINHASDGDGVKHLPLPPISLKSNLKFILVIGDPIAALASLFHRGFHHEQSIKLQRYRKDIRSIPIEMTAAEYVARETDLLPFDDQVRAWTDTALYRDTLLIKFDRLHDCLDDVRDFLELPRAFKHHFPARRPRTATPLSLGKMEKRFLEETYKTTLSYMDQQHGTFRFAPSTPFLKHLIKNPVASAVRMAVKERLLKKSGFMQRFGGPRIGSL